MVFTRVLYVYNVFTIHLYRVENDVRIKWMYNKNVFLIKKKVENKGETNLLCFMHGNYVWCGCVAYALFEAGALVGSIKMDLIWLFFPSSCVHFILGDACSVVGALHCEINEDVKGKVNLIEFVTGCDFFSSIFHFIVVLLLESLSECATSERFDSSQYKRSVRKLLHTLQGCNIVSLYPEPKAR